MSELELTGEHVAMLGDEDLRSLVVKLCEAELRRTGQPSSAVLAGGNQTAPDGGVDVRVRLETTHGAPARDSGATTSATAAASVKEPAALAALYSEPRVPPRDFILRPDTGFQVKCENMPAGAITEEMRPKGVLRDCIKDLIARTGAYVIVSSKGTVSDVYLAKRVQAMRDAVADQPSHSDLQLDFYDRDRLARWVRQYPGVELWLRERVNARLQGWQGYLHDTEEACAIASRWMDDEKWLADPAQLNELGRKLFINLAPLVPEKVLVAMERALSSGNAANFVLRHKHSVHEWSTLLRHLAYRPESFDSAALLLLTLAEHEEGNNVDSRGAWKEMFRIGLSGTMAPPAQRVRLLEHLLTTATGKRRELSWAAVEAMLEANHISSSHDFSFGARPHGYGWEPESHAEVLTWFESAFALLRRVTASEGEGLQRVRTALAAHFREVWACGVDDQLNALMLEVAGSSGWPAGWVATRSTLRFDSMGMSPEARRTLKALDAAMAPKGLAQEVRTYTLGHAGGMLDVSDAMDESDETEDKNPVTSWERVNERVVDLGTALAVDDAVLEQVLPSLLAEESGRQNYLGQGLGEGTPAAQRHWQMLRDAFVELPGEPNVSLLAGFVRGLRSKHPERAVVILDSVVGDAKLDVYYAALLGAPRDDADGDRLIASMKRAVSKAHRYILRTSHGDDGGLSVAKFCEAMQTLSKMENGLIAAIDELGTELHRWRARKAEVPPEVVVLARSLLANFSFESRTHNVAWRVNELAKIAFVGPLAVDSTAQFAARFAAALDDYRSHGEDFGDLACTLFKLQPLVALDAFLSKPNPKRHLGFRARFIARHGPIVQCAPEEVLLQWVRADPGIRAPVVAGEIELFEKKTKENASALDDSASEVTLGPVAARLLELAPDKGAVLQGFNKHFHPSHWSGSLAQTLAPHLALVERLVGHADSVVAAWAQEALKVMRQRIEYDRSTDIIREQSFE